MMEWWNNLQARERIIVAGGAGLVIAAVIYLFVWTPIMDSRDNKKMRVDNKRETLAWMMQKKKEVEQLKRVNPNLFNQVADKRSLLAIVDTGAKQMGVRTSITRIEPNGEEVVQIWLENMVFDRLIVLLGELDRRNHIQVSDVALNKSEEIGKVTGKITLTR